MTLNLTPAMDKTRNLLMSLAMDDKALPVAFITLGIILIVHSMRPPHTPVHTVPSGAVTISEAGI